MRPLAAGGSPPHNCHYDWESALRLQWNNVDFKNRRVCLWTSKRAGGDKEYDWLPMTDELFDALFTHRQEVEGEWVFPNPLTGLPFVSRQHWMKALCGLARVRRFVSVKITPSSTPIVVMA